MQPKFSHRRYVRRPTSNTLAKEIQWLLEEKYKGYKGLFFAKDVERLQKGELVDYVIGFVDFLGCKIDLSKKPFIPRPETEHWVRQAIQEVQKSNNCKKNVPVACLDMFSGSGCIGIAALKCAPNTVIDFAEKERKFCDQIKINVKLNGIDPKRYRIVRSDIFSGLKGKKYDFIFTNPPYIAESRKSKVQKSVLNHEPREALFAGKDGLDVIHVFLSLAKDFLLPGGKIYLEFDSFQKPLITKIMRSYNFRTFKFFKDQYSKWRFVVVEN